MSAMDAGLYREGPFFQSLSPKYSISFDFSKLFIYRQADSGVIHIDRINTARGFSLNLYRKLMAAQRRL